MQQGAQGGLQSEIQVWEADATRKSDRGPTGGGPVQEHNQHHLSQVQI